MKSSSMSAAATVTTMSPRSSPSGQLKARAVVRDVGLVRLEYALMVRLIASPR